MTGFQASITADHHRSIGRSPRTLLCLHCSTGSSRQWRRLAADLEATHRVIAPDLLGYGDNAPWKPNRRLRLETEVQRLLPLLLSSPGPVDVVAHSFGAAVALKLALLYPHRVRSLTLYEPVLFGLLRHGSGDGPVKEDGFAEILAMSARVRASLDAGRRDYACRAFIDFWSGEGAWEHMPEARRAGVRDCIEKVRADFGALLGDETTVADLAALEIPALCLAGDESPAATRRIAEIIADAIPGARGERFADAGHMGPLTHPGEVNGAIRKFLRFPSADHDDAIAYTPMTARAA